jgi:beta-lactamase regulating signal transducer with metallopeptidase domain
LSASVSGLPPPSLAHRSFGAGGTLYASLSTPAAGLLWLWSAGACFLALCLAVTYYRTWKRVTRCRSLVNVPVLNLLEDCKQLMGVRTPVTLVETGAVESPSLFGFVRPRLLLPAGLATSFSLDELRYVFLHELGHLKRRDIPTGWVMTLLQILHWFNPLVWWGFHRMRADRELACDALALSYANEAENQPYGRTIIKLLEGFGCSAWAPSLAGTVENKNQIKERIEMIAKFKKTNRGLAAAMALFAALGLLTLTDAQHRGHAAPPAQAETPRAGNQWELQQKLKMAAAGNQWAVYDLWDAYYRGHHGISPDPAEAAKWLQELVRDVWVVRFEPVDDFAPTNPAEFLGRIHKYSSSRSGQTNIGAASFFRTTKQGDKLAGSFLSNYPDQLKASLAKVPGLKVTSSERIGPEEFVKYEESRQESLAARWDLQQKLKMAAAGNQWAVYDLWDGYYRGHHGIQPDPAEAAKWLQELVRDVWVVRFEPADDFAPTNPEEFLGRINAHSSSRSGPTNIGEASFFRTTRQGDKLVGSFLSNDPGRLKLNLAKVPGLKVTSAERMTPEAFVKYEKSPQESL